MRKSQVALIISERERQYEKAYIFDYFSFINRDFKATAEIIDLPNSNRDTKAESMCISLIVISSTCASV